MFSNVSQKETSKSLDEYINDYPTFLLSDYETLKNSIFDNKRYVTATSSTSNKRIKNRNLINKKLDNSWDNIPGIVLGIRDNDQLINTLNTCKRQKMGLGYIFIESLQYISIIIKKPNSYPLVIIRIPIEQPFIYADNNMKGIYFEFPIEQLIIKENNSKSKNKQYRMYLTKNNNYMITLEVLYNNEIKKRTIDNVKQCDNIVINELLKLTMLNYLNTFKLDKVSDVAYSINNMDIIFIKKLQNNQTPIVFDQLQSKQIAYLEFDNDVLKFVIKGVDRIDEQNVLTKNDTLYWPQINYDKNKYVIHNYEPMFKISHYSLGTTKDSNYYIMTTFQNTYMFIKLITDQNIIINNEDNTYTFQDIFNKGTNILEMYLLIQDDNI